MSKNRPLRLFGASMAVALSGAGLAGMTALAQDESPAASAGTGSEQVVQEVQEGDLCTPAAYGGTGVEVIDLATATIGFAQSEKEANPFRIAETQSIKDEAASSGHQPHHHQRRVRPQQGDLGHQVRWSTRAPDALIISPLNSEGLDQALDYATEQGVPIMTIDRFLTIRRRSATPTSAGSARTSWSRAGGRRRR